MEWMQPEDKDPCENCGHIYSQMKIVGEDSEYVRCPKCHWHPFAHYRMRQIIEKNMRIDSEVCDGKITLSVDIQKITKADMEHLRKEWPKVPKAKVKGS